MRALPFGLLVLFLLGCSTVRSDTDDYTDADFALANQQKARTAVPEDPKVVTVAQIVAWSAGREMPESGIPRERWQQTERAYIYGQESVAVRVIGYLLDARLQPDSDIHLSIGEQANSNTSTCFIAEMTPPFQQIKHWQVDSTRRYLHQQVRITGWLLWDEQHHPGPDRATVWEIHPVVTFEVLDSGAWHPI